MPISSRLVNDVCDDVARMRRSKKKVTYRQLVACAAKRGVGINLTLADGETIDSEPREAVVDVLAKASLLEVDDNEPEPTDETSGNGSEDQDEEVAESETEILAGGGD